jgi:hypothetical protein
MTYGSELMKQINDGMLKQAPTEYVEKVRGKIAEACEELLEIGARIRPLIADKKQVGWVRGIHPAERKILDRWLYAPEDLLVNVLSLATSFSVKEIEELPNGEIRGLLSIISKMTDYDISLYPYLGAYVTTMSSENLWHGKGTRLSAFENRQVALPDGKSIRILTPPDHAKLWATLCTYREQAKKRLDENFNAVLIIRPWAGKSADPIAAELRNVAKTMLTNAIEPWQNVVKVSSEVDVNDGWAHPGDSVEDLQREMMGFIEGKDRHEQVMAQLEKQMRVEAEGRKAKLDDMVQKRGGPGVYEQEPVILTDAEVRRREQDLKRGRPVVQPVEREDREVSFTPAEKLKKYR